MATPQEYLQAKALEKTLARQGQHELVGLAQAFSAMPAQTLPTPNRRRQYLHAQIHPKAITSPSNWLLRYSIASAATLLILFSLAASVTYSKPGDSFYAYKSQAQAWRVNLESNPAKQADLRLAYAEKQLTEATGVLLDSTQETQTKAKIVAVLTQHTEEAANQIQKYAVAKKDVRILDKLAALAQNQARVISQVKSEAPEAVPASIAGKSEENSKQIAETKKLVIATSTEAALANLGSAQNDPVTTDDKKPAANDNTDTILQTSKAASSGASEATTQQVTKSPTKIDLSSQEISNEPTPEADLQGGFLVENPAPLFEAHR